MISNKALHSRRPSSAKDQKNFLEALRSLGDTFTESIEEDLLKGIPKTAYEQLTGLSTDTDKNIALKPNQAVNFDQLKQEKVLERTEQLTNRFTREFADVQQQERLVWSNQEKETQMEVRAILEELKRISAALPTLAKEIQQATDQIPSQVGTYHKNFFHKLRQSLIEFRKRVDESATWLSQFNKRASKKGGYWGNFKKQGTKFLLSADRYMSTQVG